MTRRILLAGPALPVLVAVIAAAVACLRVYTAALGSTVPGYWEGEWEYHALGARLASEGRFALWPGAADSGVRMPLYPEFLSWGQRLLPGLAGSRLAWGATQSLQVPVAYALGSVFGGPWAGALAAGGAALHPALTRGAADVQLEGFLGLMCGLAVLSLIRLVRARDPRPDALALGFLLAAACMTRSSAALLAVAAIAAAAAFSPKSARLGVLLRVAGPLALSLGLWSARNAAALGSAFPGESMSAARFVWLGATGSDEAYSELDMGRLRNEDRQEYIAAHAQPEVERGRSLLQSARRVSGNSWGVLSWAPAERLGRIWSEQWLLVPTAAAAAWASPHATLAWILPASLSVHALFGSQARYLRPAGAVLCALAAAGLLVLLGISSKSGAEASGWALTRGGAGFAAALLLTLFVSTARARRPAEVYLTPGCREAKAFSDRAVSSVLEGDFRDAEEDLNAAVLLCPASAEARINRAALRRRIRPAHWAEHDDRCALAVIHGEAASPGFLRACGG